MNHNRIEQSIVRFLRNTYKSWRTYMFYDQSNDVVMNTEEILDESPIAWAYKLDK